MSLQFTGTDYYQATTNVNQFGTSWGKLTIAAWVYMPDVTSTDKYVFNGGSTASSTGRDNGGHFVLTTADEYLPYFKRANARTTGTSSNNLNSGGWAFVAQVYDTDQLTANGEWYSYAAMQGNTLTTFTKTGVASTAFNADWSAVDLGGLYNGSTWSNILQANTYVAHVAVWKSALTSTQIGELFNGGAGGGGKNPTAVDAANLKLYWPLRSVSDGLSTYTGYPSSAATFVHQNSGSATWNASNPTVDDPSGASAAVPSSIIRPRQGIAFGSANRRF